MNSKRNIYLLSLVSFLNDMSSEMIMPILPLFITALGGTGFAIGLIGGLRDSIASFLKVFSGYFADRAGKRKIFVFLGYLDSSIFKLLLGFSRIWQHVLFVTVFERVGKGLRTAPRDALIAESMPEEKGKGFGIHRAFDTAGAIVGTLLAFLIFSVLKMGYRGIIFIAAFISFASLIPLSFVKESRRNGKIVKSFSLSFNSLPQNLKSFIGIASIFAFANISYMFFILKAKLAFPTLTGVSITILLYVLFNIFYAVLAVPFGILSDKIGRKRVLLIGYILFVFTALGFAFANSLKTFIPLFALYGTVYAIVDSNERAFVSDMAPSSIKATALGAFHTAIGLVALPAGVIAGLLWKIKPEFTFFYSAIFTTLATLLLALTSFNNKNF